MITNGTVTALMIHLLANGQSPLLRTKSALALGRCHNTIIQGWYPRVPYMIGEYMNIEYANYKWEYIADAIYPVEVMMYDVEDVSITSDEPPRAGATANLLWADKVRNGIQDSSMRSQSISSLWTIDTVPIEILEGWKEQE